MKKVLVLLVVTLTSCHLPRYTHSGDVNSLLDFSKGKWLLNTIESPKDLTKNLTQIANEEFSNLIPSRFSILSDTNGVLIPTKISHDPSQSVLTDIKNGSKYDFFINIRAKKISDQIDNGIQLTDIESSVNNSGEIIIDIYDLNLLEKIYSQTVIASVSIQNESADYILIKEANDLILSGFNRIIKKIKKNQINSSASNGVVRN